MPFVGSPDTYITNPRWRKNRKIAIYLPRFDRFFDGIWHADAVRNSWPFRPLKFEISKIQDGGGCHVKKSKTDISPPWFERFRQNLTLWRSSSFLTVPIVKILKIQDDCCRHLKKSKIKISGQRLDRSTLKFGMVTQFDTYDASHS